MNKFPQIKLLFLVAAMAVLLANCTSSDPRKKDDMIDSTKIVQPKKSANVKTNYKLPSPVQLYVFIRDEGAHFNKDVLNSVDNLSKYNTTKSKAINFGIYAADLAYCTVFAKPQQTFFYFKSAKTIANDLGLTQGFDELISKRIENNLNNTDSLFQITSDSYWDACQFLEQTGKSDILGFILVGGWIESVNLAINSVDKFSADNAIVGRITEQQLLLDNLLENLKAVNKNDQISDIISKLTELKISFDKVVIGDPVNKNVYNEIATKVKALRNEFIKG